MSDGHLRRPRHSWGRAVFPLHPEEISARIVPLHAVQPKRDPYHPYPCAEFCLAARMRQALRPGWGRCREPLRCSVGLPCLQLMTAYAALAKPSSADPALAAHGNSTVHNELLCSRRNQRTSEVRAERRLTDKIEAQNGRSENLLPFRQLSRRDKPQLLPMINVTPYHVNRTRLYYENLHKAYRSEHATNALNPPIFSRAFCGGGNGNGPAFRQDVRSHVALPLSSHHADAHVAVPSRR